MLKSTSAEVVVVPSTNVTVPVSVMVLPLLFVLVAVGVTEIDAMPKSARENNSPSSVWPSPSRSFHNSNELNPASCASTTPSPFESYSASAAYPDWFSEPNSSVISSILPLPLLSTASRASSAATQPVCSANPSPSISKNAAEPSSDVSSIPSPSKSITSGSI